MMNGVDQIAIAFHECYEKLAPDFFDEVRRDKATPWEEIPEDNRLLILAVVEELLAAGVIETGFRGISGKPRGVRAVGPTRLWVVPDSDRLRPGDEAS